MISPRVTAFKLKKNIWWYPADTVFDFKDGVWHTQEPNTERMQNETTLAKAIEEIVGFAPEEEMDTDTIEVLKDYKVQPPQYIQDFEGNRYKLVKK